MKNIKFYALLCSILGWNSCPGPTTTNPPSWMYSDTLGSDANNNEEIMLTGKKTVGDTTITPEEDLKWPTIPPGIPIDITAFVDSPVSDASTTKEIITSGETYRDSSVLPKDVSPGEILQKQLSETDTTKNIDAIINIASDTGVILDNIVTNLYTDAYFYSDASGEETSLESYLSPEVGDFEEEAYGQIINSPDSQTGFIKDKEECYTLAKEELSAYLIESVENNEKLELYLMVGKYSEGEDCLMFYSDSDEAYPEICTYLYAYFFSNQPFGYIHCSGSEDFGVGKSLLDYCYYEIKLPATPEEIKSISAEVVECIYNSLGSSQN